MLFQGLTFGSCRAEKAVGADGCARYSLWGRRDAGEPGWYHE